jgi:hypothetical protein
LISAAGEALSKSTLFALRREYLDAPVFERGTLKVEKLKKKPVDAAFVAIEQIGQPVAGGEGEVLNAIQTTLAACHDPRYALVFILSSDGVRNSLYLGVTARQESTQPRLFAEQVGQFLCSNWPGTRVRAIDDAGQMAAQVHVPLSSFRYARAFTGIPSTRGELVSTEAPPSLDRLMRGLRGKPYVYMVVAEPLAEKEVGGIISACHSLSGQIHAFTRSTVQMGRSRGTSETTATSESESSSTSTSTSSSTTAGDTSSKGVLGTALDKATGVEKGLKAVGLGGLSALLVAAGGPFLLSGMLGMFGQLLPSTGASSTTSQSTSESESIGRTFGTSVSEGVTSGESMSFSREILNRHAEACTQLLDQTVQRFEQARAQGCWNVGVYMISDQEEAASQAQAQLKALISGERSAFEPVRAHDLAPVWDGQVQTALDAFRHPALALQSPDDGAPLSHPLGAAFEGLSTPLNTNELALLVNLPVREMPGMPVQPTAAFSLNPPMVEDSKQRLSLGCVLEGGEAVGDLEYAIPFDSLTRHVFITGITGSGKSNTCRRLIEEMMERDVNFMVIEPAKDEYVQLALGYNQSKRFKRKIAVYAPGRETWGGHKLDQMKLNPFDIVRLEGAIVQVMPHLDRLKSIFNASFPMYEILPVILEEALVDLYDSQGWLEEELPPDGVGCPTLSNLHARIGGLVRSKGYEERITNNITAALKTRIGSLMRGWKGRLFDHPFSTPWADLFDRPVVVNLQQMGDDADKCFTMALLLNLLYEYRQAQHEVAGSPESSGLNHLAIIEEAHRVLRAATSSDRSANPQAKMGEMFADILAEIRAYGQGLAIIDQVPSKLVPDALKNTNLKIVHRLVSADDRNSMASALALTDDQAQVIARLKVGQTILSGVQDDMASWVKIHYTPLPGVKQN